MSGRSSKSSRVAYMEEEDDSGNVTNITYAASVAPGPNKERMNTSKSRRGESPGPGHGHNDSDSTAHPRRGSRAKPSRERERSIPPGKKSVTLSSRPSTRHARPPPDLDPVHHHRRRDEPEYYGVDPDTVTSASSRPRSKTAAPRPGYPGLSRPPVSNARYHQMGPPSQQFQPSPPQFQPSPLMQTSYSAPLPMPSQAPQPWQPPPPRFSPMGPPPPPMPMSLAPVNSQPMYPESFPRPQTLQQRFDLPRPQTSVGHRPQLPVDYNSSDGYYAEERPLPDLRRLSLSTRPSSARPPALQDSPFAPPIHAPPRAQQLAEYRYPDDQYDEIESVYQDTASSFYDLPPSSYKPRARRPSVGRTSVGYDSRSYGAEAPRSTAGRRDSFYGARSVSSGAGLEDKLRQASSYQEEISGGVRLTAETLHEANRSDGPRSRSTRSSGSRDESDWRQSATTRTTRSSTAEDDRTMKVRGPAFIRMGETEVQCEMGAEVDITPSGMTAGRRGDRSSYIESDDHRSRFDRPALRSRAASQAPSYAQHAVAPYGYSYGNGLDYTRLPYGN